VEGFRHPNLIGMRIFGGRSVSGERVVSHRGCQKVVVRRQEPCVRTCRH
jgi:hypothetical protein